MGVRRRSGGELQVRSVAELGVLVDEVPAASVVVPLEEGKSTTQTNKGY